MKKICVVDRVEDGIITLLPDDGGESIELFAKDHPDFSPNCAVVLENGTARLAKEGEREDKTEQNRERLKRLFDRK